VAVADALARQTLPLSEVKAKLSRLVDRVAETDEEILITRNGRPAAVLVSPDEYESWRETRAVQSDRELMQEIRRGSHPGSSSWPQAQG
jgi:prevent-host-death family protein